MSNTKQVKTAPVKKHKEPIKPYNPMYSSLLAKDETLLMDKYLYY